MARIFYRNSEREIEIIDKSIIHHGQKIPILYSTLHNKDNNIFYESFVLNGIISIGFSVPFMGIANRLSVFNCGDRSSCFIVRIQ